MDKIKYSGEVDDKGKLKVYQQRTFKLEIEQKFKGKEVWVIIEKRNPKMSKNQRGYLFGVIVPRFQHGLRNTGLNLTEGETKIWIEKHFITRHLDDGTEVTGAISDLDKAGMTQLIDELIRFAAMELDEVIPFPGEFEG